MVPRSVPKQAAIAQFVPGAYFHDCYQIQLPAEKSGRNPLRLYLEATKAVPAWINGSMRLRNAVVSRLGLKDLGSFDNVDEKASFQIGDRVGIFRLAHQSPNEVILEDNDKHLHVKVAVVIEDDVDNKGKVLSVSTVVHVHNNFGKIYMFFVEPMHKLIAPTVVSYLL